MIKDTCHAFEVQARRLASGKKGVAKAVRRFNRKIAVIEWQQWQLNGNLPADFSGCRSFENSRG